MLFRSPHVDDFKDFGVPRVNVVRCALAKQRGTDDWRRSAIFQTYTKCGDKTCKVIIDSGSCINAVSSSVVSRLGLKLTLHPNLYKVFWVDTSSIAIKERCVVPLQFLTYKAEIWCDVIPMDVGHIILGDLGFMIWMSPFMGDPILAYLCSKVRKLCSML